MAKDPAFLFYYQDFLVGTEFMSAAETGVYIRILCHLADKGKLSEEHIKNICKDVGFTQVLRNKLQQDKDGSFYNKRLNYEADKRKNYCNSRRDNRLPKKHMKNTCKTYVRHMENENEDENKDENKDVIKEEKEGIVKGRFQPPSVEAVSSYCRERKNAVDAQTFVDFYESKGWMIGKNKMKDWRAAVRTWEKNQKENANGTHKNTNESLSGRSPKEEHSQYAGLGRTVEMP